MTTKAEKAAQKAAEKAAKKAQKDAEKAAKLGAGEADEAALETAVDEAVAAPGDSLQPSPARAPKPLKEGAVKEVEDEDGAVRRYIDRTGRFEAIGNEIFNREGVLIGTEDSESVAARKADRFESMTPKVKRS